MTDRHPDENPTFDEEPDFAEEHTRPTYEDESADLPGSGGDESIQDGPAGEQQDEPTGPL